MFLLKLGRLNAVTTSPTSPCTVASISELLLFDSVMAAFPKLLAVKLLSIGKEYHHKYLQP